MRSFVLLVGAVLLAVGCFAAGDLTAGLRNWFAPIVHVTIENDSGEDLIGLVLVHESSRTTSTVSLPALKSGQSTDIKFFVAGEGGYMVEAMFAGGRMLKGGAGYVEAGYSVHEIIRKDAISSR